MMPNIQPTEYKDYCVTKEKTNKLLMMFLKLNYVCLVIARHFFFLHYLNFHRFLNQGERHPHCKSGSFRTLLCYDILLDLDRPLTKKHCNFMPGHPTPTARCHQYILGYHTPTARSHHYILGHHTSPVTRVGWMFNTHNNIALRLIL